MIRVEVRRQRFVRNRPSVARYSFIDGPRRRGGRGVRLTVGRWIAYLDYRVRRLRDES